MHDKAITNDGGEAGPGGCNTQRPEVEIRNDLKVRTYLSRELELDK